ncbi:MAG: hypothetical protein AAF481_04890 [Acidobacteriota bacterium]
MKRTLIDVAIVAVAILAIWGVWSLKENERERELEAQANRWNSRLMTFQTEAKRLQEEAAQKEAEAVFRSLAAGILPMVLSKDSTGLNQAVSAALEIEGIDSLHVVGPRGSVLAGSDRKLITTGRIDERDGWILETDDLTTKPSGVAGVTQMAAPFVGASGPAGFLWLAYETGSEGAQEAPEVQDAA